MPVYSNHVPQLSYRGVRHVQCNFAGTQMFLVQNEGGELIGEFRVPTALATPEFEQMLLDWLERADPVVGPGPTLSLMA